MSSSLNYKTIQGPAHLCFIPSASDITPTQEEDHQALPPLPFRGHLINNKRSQSYALRGKISVKPPPLSHAHHVCVLEPPVYYDLFVHDYKTHHTWKFQWVKWWGGDAGWLGTEDDGGQGLILKKNQELDAEHDEIAAKVVSAAIEAETDVTEKDYIGFSTQVMISGEQALKYVKNYLNPGVLNELDKEKRFQVRVCLGEMLLVVSVDDEDVDDVDENDVDVDVDVDEENHEYEENGYEENEYEEHENENDELCQNDEEIIANAKENGLRNLPL
ncbi:hypothetical protein G9A89_015178 [Geosiphon pyriformis]|nr:hypothetical protein G9A89_015178 [Geosiphon pyriformis]